MWTGLKRPCDSLPHWISVWHKFQLGKNRRDMQTRPRNSNQGVLAVVPK